MRFDCALILIPAVVLLAACPGENPTVEPPLPDAGLVGGADAGTTGDAGTAADGGTQSDAGTNPDAGLSWWIPSPGTAWQWQLADLPVDTSVDVPIYDLDVDDTPSSTVAMLQDMGRRVICYIDVGTWESYRSDADEFPESILGLAVDGWPEERWLDIRALDEPAGPTGKTLRTLLEARLDVCAAKGFDAVEPDWLDGYAHSTGFPLTAADQLVFNRFIAQAAHARGLAVGLKNDKEQTAELVSDFDFGVDEECQVWSECLGEGTEGDPGWKPFVDAGKAVLHAEYSDQVSSCTQPPGFSSILKNRELDAWREPCTP